MSTTHPTEDIMTEHHVVRRLRLTDETRPEEQRVERAYHVAMPSDYDPAGLTYEDVIYDGAMWIVDPCTDADRWLTERGYVDGSAMARETEDGEYRTLPEELDAEPDAITDRLWLCPPDDDPLDATPCTAYVWPDGSGVLLTDAWWDLVEQDYTTTQPARVLSDTEIEQEAKDAAPVGWTIERGMYMDWLAYPDNADAWDRSGPGHATIRDALDWIAEHGQPEGTS